MIPIHPQSCAGEPERLRWITPVGVLSFTGTPAAVPVALAALLHDGTLAAVRVEPAAIVTTLSAGRDWSRDGSRVRSALHAALDDPAGWASSDTTDDTADQALRAAAEALLNGSVGDLAISHGGSIKVLDARDGVVTVQLEGACHGCAAAPVTLRQRLEEQLRRRCPDLRAVVDAGATSVSGKATHRP